MPRPVVAAITVAIMTVSALQAPLPASATPRGDQWRARALAAVTHFETHDQNGETAFAYAYMTQAIAWLYGWDDPRVGDYLAKVYSRRNPDGGWGLPYALDWLADGSVNPATTTYTVTLAGHVGPMLIEGYKAGKVPYADVKKVVDLLMSTPRVTYDTTRGQCLGYSRVPSDAQFCVHNVNAGAAWFLTKANEAGVQAQGLTTLVGDIIRRETATYIVGPYTVGNRTVVSWWKYKDTTSLNDTDHNSYSAASMYDLVPYIGQAAVWNHMNNALADNDVAPLAHIRLSGLSGRPGTLHPSGTTWWCYLGDQWAAETDAYISANSSTPGRMAQVAYYSARNALSC
jgi:hypothetical protein